MALTEHFSDCGARPNGLEGRTLVGGADDRRTEHLESLPDGLLVDNPMRRVRVGAVLDALHVLANGEAR